MRDDEAPEVVTASEIGSWAWCPESWRLDALGDEPTNVQALARGEAKHVETARAERRARLLASFGSWLVVVGGVLGLLDLAGLLP